MNAVRGAAMDPFSLEDKNIVITGASSGLGHHFSGVLSLAGANVVLGARREDMVAARVEEIRAGVRSPGGGPCTDEWRHSKFWPADDSGFAQINSGCSSCAHVEQYLVSFQSRFQLKLLR